MSLDIIFPNSQVYFYYFWDVDAKQWTTSLFWEGKEKESILFNTSYFTGFSSLVYLQSQPTHFCSIGDLESPVRKHPTLYPVSGNLPDVHRWWVQEKATFLLVEAWYPYASTHSWWASLCHMTCQECARVGINIPYCVLFPFPLRTTPIIWLCV